MEAGAKDAMFIIPTGVEADEQLSAKIDYLSFAFAGLSISGKADAADRYLTIARNLRGGLKKDYNRDNAGWSISWAHAWAGQWDEADQVVKSIDAAETRRGAQADVAIAHLWRGEREQYDAAMAKSMNRPICRITTA